MTEKKKEVLGLIVKHLIELVVVVGLGLLFEVLMSTVEGSTKAIEVLAFGIGMLWGQRLWDSVKVLVTFK